MQRSTERFLTTHQGGLPRPAELTALLQARQSGASVDAQDLAARVRQAVAEVVRQQVACGLDIVNDGEVSKTSWLTYFSERLAGTELRVGSPSQPAGGMFVRDRKDFPQWFALAESAGGPWFSWVAGLAAERAGTRQPTQAVGRYCVGPLQYIGQAQVQTDIDNLKAAAVGQPVADLFLTALGPAIAFWGMRNEYYPSEEEALFAYAEAMRAEYQAITEAGIILQVDDPSLATNWHNLAGMSVEEFRRWLEVRIEALNVALQGIPPERVRLHVCWGSPHFPHKNDIPLEAIADIILRANVQTFSFEASNPRHDHDWRVWQTLRLPEGRILMPGVVGHFTDLIEHPSLVAERLAKYASVVGAENVIGGTDCGLGSRVGTAEICWAKLEALAEGARQASAASFVGRRDRE